jgi:hypothetical protein
MAKRKEKALIKLYDLSKERRNSPQNLWRRQLGAYRSHKTQAKP